jgi:hypothetical protein
MPLNFPFVPILADAEAVIAVIVILVTIIGWVANLVSNKNQKGPPVGNRPRPPARPRDERLQEEISIFIEDAGGQRSRQGSRGVSTARQPAASRNPPGKRPPASPPKKPARRPRPGEQMATRQAPVTETLGTGVKQHVSQTMTERVSREVQQRLAPRVEEKVAEDLGPLVTTGAARAASSPAPALPRVGPERFAELLRNRSGVQQAIVMNLILSPPAYRTRASRR